MKVILSKIENARKIILYVVLYIVTVGIIASVFILNPHTNNDYPMFRLFIVVFATVLLTKYFIYMTISPWHDVLMRRKDLQRQLRKEAPYLPRVSIIIPAWNEEVGLLATVKTILANTYPKIEIVVVNDGSTDNSDRMMREFVWHYEAAKTPDQAEKKILYHYKENGGKGRALNRGIELSTGAILISIDADCALRSDTIENFVKYFWDPKVMAAVGNVKIGNTSTLLGVIQHLEFLFSFYFKKAESLANTIYIIGGAAGAFRREVFDEIGQYNPSNITEDIELSVRIQDAGMRVVYASDAIVYTEGAVTIEGLMKQRLRWKRGRFQTFFEHRHLFLSLEPQHNKLLTWLVLPLAIFGETQLFFEVIFLIFLYIYSLLTHDFSSFISGIMVVSSMFLVIMFFDDTSKRRASFYLLAPIGWLLFYVSTVVEYNALIKSIWHSLRKKKMVWQKWERKGCIDPKNTVI